MAKAIVPKLVGSARTRSSEGQKTLKLDEQPSAEDKTTGGTGSSRDDKPTRQLENKLPRLDVITKLIVDGDEEHMLEVIRGWGSKQLADRTLEFLERNKTGVDKKHALTDKLVKLTNFQATGVLMRMYEQKTIDARKNTELWKSLVTDGGSDTEEENKHARHTTWEEAPMQDEDDTYEDIDENIITSDDTMMIISYFASLRDHEGFVDSGPNNSRIDLLSFMIEHLKLDLKNYNAFLEHTRQELDDTIVKYKPVLGQNNWKMQAFLMTNLKVRRDAAKARHPKTFTSLEEAQANRLEFTPWWSDKTGGDVYRGGRPHLPEVNVRTLGEHKNFVNERRSQSRPSGAPLDEVTRRAMEGMNMEEDTNRQRRGRSPGGDRQTGRSNTMAQEMSTQNMNEMRISREEHTLDWTKDMETNFLNPMNSRHGQSNRTNWMQLSEGMKNIDRKTYRTAQGRPITSPDEQDNHFAAHLKHIMDLHRNYRTSSEEYWRIINYVNSEGVGSLSTKPCKYFSEGTLCRNGENCHHLHVRLNELGGGTAGGSTGRGTKRRG